MTRAGSSRWVPPVQFEHYRRKRLLGRGAMGQVFLYYDTELERQVAIKFVSGGSEPQQLLAEARVAAKIHHPNIVTIHEVGDIDGHPYIVSEFIRGRCLDREKPLHPWRRILTIGNDLACGLAAAHRRGVLHRDIKPANAMVVDETGVAKLIDFGVAKRLESPRSDDPFDTSISPLGGLVYASDSDVVGTPAYVAPEVWAGEPTTPRSDVYSFGVLLYELCTGRLPPNALDRSHRSAEDHDSEYVDGLEILVPDVEPEFLAIVRRCMAHEPERRYASGEELRAAFERVGTAGVRRGSNPYRWLLPFEAQHRALFYGRGGDITRVLERLRSHSLVILAGGSGVGKSSLARAGIAPSLDSEDLGEGRVWTACTMKPGVRPLPTIVRVLAGRLGMETEELEHDIRERRFIDIRRRLRELHGDSRGTLILLDQLEELLLLADPRESELVCELLASCIVEQTPGLRVLATARLDHWVPLTRLPGLGPLVQAALYLVGPLTKAAIRETIVGPAHATGVRFESDELVGALVRASVNAEGSLPLLQFALSQLWEARDKDRGLITLAVFAQIGGVEGALAKHADSVLGTLVPDTRKRARRILLMLVSVSGTRSRRSQDELLESDIDRTALESLVQGRLVVASESDGQAVYELAHEALTTAWPTLREWLDKASESRAVKARLARAAAEWERMGRSRDALWRRRQLAEARMLDPAMLSDIERTFVAASRRSQRRARWRWRLIGGLFLASIVVVVGVVRHVEATRRHWRAGEQLEEARRALAAAPSTIRSFRDARAQIDEQLAAGRIRTAEAAWLESIATESALDHSYREASRALEAALGIDPNHASARALFGRVLDERARLADERGRRGERDELLGRLLIHDPVRHRRWQAEVAVVLTLDPPDTRFRIDRYSPTTDGRLGLLPVHEGHPVDAPQELSLVPGSYILTVPADAHRVEVRYPFVLDRTFEAPAEESAPRHSIILERPERSAIPVGFVYIPAGQFYYGYGQSLGDEPRRVWHETTPLHRRSTDAYLIARHETTYGQWIEFLDACRANSCSGIRAAVPSASESYFGYTIALRDLPDDGWELLIEPQPGVTIRARQGQETAYAARKIRPRHDWSRMPVTGVSAGDVHDYLRWLRRSGRVPGAMLCREDQWERAARGADARVFPHGDALGRQEANFDATYGRVPAALGPDEVGLYSASMSPFGLLDMAGNVWEMTAPLFPPEATEVTQSETFVIRGGSYFQAAISAFVVNREVFLPSQKSPNVGFRVCAPWPLPQRQWAP